MILFENSQKEEELLIQNVFERALNYLKQPQNAEISVTFLTEDEIRVLNKEYRDVDESTDVLSFPMLDIVSGEIIDEKFSQDFNFDTNNYVLGDVFISRDFVSAQAKANKKGYYDEVCYLALHSLLHLLGYDHATEQEKQIMFDLQDKIIKECV